MGNQLDSSMENEMETEVISGSYKGIPTLGPKGSDTVTYIGGLKHLTYIGTLKSVNFYLHWPIWIPRVWFEILHT